MSFLLSAVGTLDDVRQQLAAADLKHGGDLAEAARTLVTEAVADVDPKPTYPGQEKRFVVEASGHKDANATSLNVSVRTFWVPVAAAEPAADSTDA